jgi:hypothetical protein
VGDGGVVLDPPVLDEDAGFRQRGKRLDGEQFVAEPAAEALRVPFC